MVQFRAGTLIFGLYTLLGLNFEQFTHIIGSLVPCFLCLGLPTHPMVCWQLWPSIISLYRALSVVCLRQVRYNGVGRNTHTTPCPAFPHLLVCLWICPFVESIHFSQTPVLWPKPLYRCREISYKSFVLVLTCPLIHFLACDIWRSLLAWIQKSSLKHIEHHFLIPFQALSSAVIWLKELEIQNTILSKWSWAKKILNSVAGLHALTYLVCFIYSSHMLVVYHHYSWFTFIKI